MVYVLRCEIWAVLGVSVDGRVGREVGVGAFGLGFWLKPWGGVVVWVALGLGCRLRFGYGLKKRRGEGGRVREEWDSLL